MYVPDLLAFCVAPNDAVDERRFARLGVRVVVPDRVDLDVLGGVHVDELLVDVRPVGAGEVEMRIQLDSLKVLWKAVKTFKPPAIRSNDPLSLNGIC